MERIELLQNYLKSWQKRLNLQKWNLSIKLVKFNRTDFNQSGDIKVDLKDKNATILIAKDKTGKDNAVILHELIHLMLWEFDHFIEEKVPNNKKDEYFDLLEKTVADLTEAIVENGRKKSRF